MTVCRSSSDYVVGLGEGLVVALWRFRTNAEDVQELAAAVKRAHAASGQPIRLIQIVSSSAISPDARARAALARMLRQLDGIVSHSAIVHEAEGFRAALIRSIVTAVAALSNPGFPHRVFSTMGEAAEWMGQDTARWSARQIVSTLGTFRAAIPSMKGAGHLSAEETAPRSP